VYCKGCGQRTDDRERVCGACGTLLPQPCPNCQVRNDPEARFCTGCGSSRETPAGERKHVTVLFADLEGATAMIAGIDPEDAHETIDPALRTMRSVVRGYGGSVNRVAGDGIMALFGAPRALEDHAVQACYAALALTEEIPRVTGDLLRVRVGLHSGDVLVRGIENDFATDYDAVGETPHVAHRMETLAPSNGACASAATIRLAEGWVQARSLGRIRVRGLRERLEVFELLGRARVASTLDARATRGLTRFVGRAEEMALLQRTLEQVERGKGAAVAISGEAGIGKSRLTRELCERAAARGWRTVVEGGLSDGQATSYRPLGRLLRAWLQVDEHQSQQEVRASLRRHVDAIGAVFDRHLAGLQSLLDLPVDDPAWADLDPAQRQAEIIDALAALVLLSASGTPHLVVLEDLQRADEETRVALATLAERVADASVLLLVTERVEAGSGLWQAPGLHRIPLAPLVERDERRILDLLLGPDASLDPLKSVLAERTGGNPLYLEESVRDLIDAGLLAGEGGAFRFLGRLQTLRIPGSVKDVIASRIDRLQARLIPPLQTAAVVGRRFTRDVLSALLEEGGEGLAAALAELEERGFVHPVGDGDDPAWAFRHALIQEVAYQGLLRHRRRELHARVVGVIEGLHPDRLVEHVDELAEHALAGQLWDRAARYRLMSCKAAIERSASRQAVATFDRALETFDQMPRDQTIAKASIDLRAVVLNALLPLGDHERLLRNLREAEQLAESIGDLRRLGLVQSNLGMTLWLSGQNAAALEMTQKALAIATRLGNEALALGTMFNLGMIHHALGEYRQAIEVHAEILPALTGARESQRMNWGGYPGVFVRTFLAQSCLELGRTDEAADYVAYGSALADRFRHPYSQAMIRSIEGQLLLARDRPTEAIAMLDETLALCLAKEIHTMRPLIAARLAMAWLRIGEVRRPGEILAPVLEPEVFRRSGVYIWADLFLAAAETHLAAGATDEAVRYTRDAEILCRRNGALGQLAYSLELLGRIDRDREDAATATREAAEIARRLGMLPLLQRLGADG